MKAHAFKITFTILMSTLASVFLVLVGCAKSGGGGGGGSSSGTTATNVCGSANYVYTRVSCLPISKNCGPNRGDDGRDCYDAIAYDGRPITMGTNRSYYNDPYYRSGNLNVQYNYRYNYVPVAYPVYYTPYSAGVGAYFYIGL